MGIEIRDLQIVLLGAWFFGLGSISAAPAADQPLNVLLITLDTTRSDHLGCYGYSKAKTPAIDRLASEGARFESAFSSVPITLPSHATIITGQYPFRTGVRDNGLDRLPDSALTLAEILQSHHYHTAAFVSAAVLDRVFGLNQGFDLYDDNVRVGHPQAFRYEERAASQVTQAVLDNAGKMSSPFFLWVHYYDPHLPYVPPSPFDKQFEGDLYDGEIAFVDHEIAVLLESLDHKKLLDHTLIVIAGDHGESLGDHGEKTHGVFLYDSVLHVPLIIRCPEAFSPVVVHGIARLVDIFPTLLDYLNIHRPSNLDGVSLRTAINTGKTETTGVYQESLLPFNSFGWSPLFAIRSTEWHYIEAPEKELYDVAGDEKEAMNISKKSPKQVANLLKQLSLLKKSADGHAPVQISNDLREQLSSLGYVSSGRTPVANGMDPKKGVPIMNQIDEARLLLGQGKLKQGQSILEDVVKKNPQNVPARTSLGNALFDQQEYIRAQTQYEAALKIAPSDYLFVDLGQALSKEKKAAEARKQFEAALSVNPRFVQAYLSWASMELAAGETAKATEVLDRAIKADVRDPNIFLIRGKLAAAANDLSSALTFFQYAIEQNPDLVDAHKERGHALYLMKQMDSSIAAYEKALSLQPEDTAMLKTLASIYLYERNDPVRAKALFEKALQLDPQAPDAGDLQSLIKELSQQ